MRAALGIGLMARLADLAVNSRYILAANAKRRTPTAAQIPAAASEEFENGVRVGMLLQLLWSDGAAHPDEALDTLKELHTPVAKLHNWNALLPRLKARGAEVDADMKVLIVAGDADIVVDVLEQLRVADRRVKAVLRRKDEISQPATAGGDDDFSPCPIACLDLPNETDVPMRCVYPGRERRARSK